MRREKRNQNEVEKIKWGKLISFLIAIILLGVAIAISMNQERNIGKINYNNLKNSNDIKLLTEEASSELSKKINEVKESNENLTTKEKSEEENVISVNKNNTEKEENNENTTTKKQNNTNTVNEVKENNVEQEKKDSKENTNKTEFIFPVEGEVIKEFAKDNLIYSETLEEWITHTGIDIKAERSTIVKTVADGMVKSIKNDPRYGLTVIIEHSNGYVSSYSSLLTAEFVKEGEKVEQGQTIGTVGNSAVFEVAEDNHLHFELLKDGSNINPEMYLK